MSKHTPGPWRVQGKIVVSSTNRVVSDPDPGFAGPVRQERPYNARLIAAAPELLEALRGCADMLREAGKDFAVNNPRAARPNLAEIHERVARAAIAKATGE